MKKIFILIIVVFASIYSHYNNKHFILNCGRKLHSHSAKYKSEKDQNLLLLAENSKLSSRELIQNLAFTELDMFYPVNTDKIHTIVINDDKTFRLIDYIIPSAEALTK